MSPKHPDPEFQALHDIADSIEEAIHLLNNPPPPSTSQMVLIIVSRLLLVAACAWLAMKCFRAIGR